MKKPSLHYKIREKREIVLFLDHFFAYFAFFVVKRGLSVYLGTGRRNNSKLNTHNSAGLSRGGGEGIPERRSRPSDRSAPEEVLETTGHEVGGVCPFGLPARYRSFSISPAKDSRPSSSPAGTATARLSLRAGNSRSIRRARDGAMPARGEPWPQRIRNLGLKSRCPIRNGFCIFDVMQKTMIDH